MTDYELYHHGIKGQKWGVRRTAAQLGRLMGKAASKAGVAIGKGASKAGKAIGRSAAKAGSSAKRAAAAKVKQSIAESREKLYYRKLRKKKLSQLTDKELKDITDRIKREAGLKDAVYEKRVQNARKFYRNVAQQPINSIATVYAKEAAKAAFKTGD